MDAQSLFYKLICLPWMLACSAIGDQKIITAAPGQNITLSCRAPNNIIKVVEWSRDDLKPQYVLSYRDEQSDPEEQHPSFKDRVDLQDSRMKDGDVSLFLKHVTAADTGTYKCRVFTSGTNPHSNDPVSIIYLRVVAPPPPGLGGGLRKGGGSSGLIVGLSVPAVLLVALFVFLIYRKCKQSRGSSQPPDKERSSEMCPVYFQGSSEPSAADSDSVLSLNSGKEG